MGDRLVRRAVFADGDAVMREYVDDAQLHQRREAHRWAHVVGKREERRSVRDDAAMQRHAVQNRAHAMLTNTEMDVPPAEVVTAQVAKTFERCAVGRREVGRATEQCRQVLCQHLQGGAGGTARGDLAVAGVYVGSPSVQPAGSSPDMTCANSRARSG